MAMKMSKSKHEMFTPAEEGVSPCNTSTYSATSRQIDILENNFKFYHAWTPNSFEELECGFTRRGADYKDASNAKSECIGSNGADKSNFVVNSILVMDHPSFTSNERSTSSLADFFSAFGMVTNVEFIVDNHTKETIGLVEFEEGSDGAQKVVDSQPIKMFGNIINIKMATADNRKFSSHEHTSQQKPRNPTRKKQPYAFPLLVAPPSYGPWYQKPPQKSYLKPSTVASPPERRTRTIGKWAAAASKIVTANFNPPSTEIKSAQTAKSFHHGKKMQQCENNFSESMPSPSLHSLLSPSVRDPLFDDDSVVMGSSLVNPATHDQHLGDSAGHNAQPRTEREGVQYFHFDNCLSSWVWAPCPARRSDGDEADHHNAFEHSSKSSGAERDLRNTLQLGRASHATLPLLSVVSCPREMTQQQCPKKECKDSKPYLLEETNIHLLHKAIDVTVVNNATGDQAGCYTLYQARHPCLAPLISVTKCSDSSAFNDKGILNESKHGSESFVSVFDITPTRHRPLHELLRTGDFFTKPLYPGMIGHASEDDFSRRGDLRQYKRGDFKSPLAWFHTGDDDPGLCRCHTIFDRGRPPSLSSRSNLPQRDRDFRAELRQFTASTSSMFSMLAEQEIFDDLRKLHLLPSSSSHHPQLYSRFNQTRMLYKVGTAYHADVADLRIRFLAFQLFHAVNFFHSKGITLGDQLRPDRIFIENDWVRLVVPVESAKNNHDDFNNKGVQSKDDAEDEHRNQMTLLASDTEKAERRIIFNRYGSDQASSDGNSIKTNDATFCHENPTIIPYPGHGLVPFAQWQKGHLTNFAYLMILNAAAGR